MLGFALIRHGTYQQPANVPSAHLPHPLTDEGRAQAAAGCDALAAVAGERGWELDTTIDASPLLRAWETAEIFAARLGDYRVETFDALSERCVGSAANLTEAEIEAVIERDPRFDPLPPGWKRRSDFCLPLPGAESLTESGARVAAHIRARTEQLAGGAGDGVLIKLVVGHGGSLRHGAAELGMLEVDDLAALSMHHARAVVYLDREGRWERSFGDWKAR